MIDIHQKSVYAYWVHYAFSIIMIDIYKGMRKLSIYLYTKDEWLPTSPHTQGGTSDYRIKDGKKLMRHQQ